MVRKHRDPNSQHSRLGKPEPDDRHKCIKISVEDNGVIGFIVVFTSF